MFEYRLTERPVASKRVKGLKTLPERFAHAMTETLNTEAKSGWEFVGQESFAVEDKPGMMKKAKATELTFLIFRREVPADSVPLDQKLDDMRNKKARRALLGRGNAPIAEPVAATAAAASMDIGADEATAVSSAQRSADIEPFPEPMPMPDQAADDPFTEEPELDVSRALPFPGPSPSQTMGMSAGKPQQKLSDTGPTMNYDHSKSKKGLSVEAPILGPARRD